MAVKGIVAGDLNKIVVLKEPGYIKDDEGQREKVYLTGINASVKLVQTNNQRVMEAGAEALVDTVIVTMRYNNYRATIKKDWLIEIEGVDYNIHSIEILGKKEYIKLITKAVG